MPIAIQLSPGLLTSEGQRTVFSRISAILLDVHGLKGNKFMTPNVIGHVTVLPEGASYAEGAAQSLAVIEVKVPSITFPNAEVQRAFVARVTDVIDELKAGQHPRSRTFVSVTYARRYVGDRRQSVHERRSRRGHRRRLRVRAVLAFEALSTGIHIEGVALREAAQKQAETRGGRDHEQCAERW